MAQRFLDVWMHWTEVSGFGVRGKQRVICNYCLGHEQAKHAPKCKRHLIRCNKTPISVRNRFKQQIDSKSINNIQDEEEDQHLDDIKHDCIQILHDEETQDQFHDQIQPDSQSIPTISYVRHYSPIRKKNKVTNNRISGNDIEDYIDTFHRIKTDMKYMLTNTISERKREFISYTLQLLAQNITQEDKEYLNDEIGLITGESQI